MRRRFPLLLIAPLLAAQSQPTFYAAYQDGLDAERSGQWATAAAAYRRAIELRPASAARIVIYGNNLLKDYTPHTHLARCLLESGDLEGAQAALGRAAQFGEPAAERETLAQALIRRKIQAPPAPKEVPAQPPTEPASKPHAAAEPAPKPPAPVASESWSETGTQPWLPSASAPATTPGTVAQPNPGPREARSQALPVGVSAPQVAPPSPAATPKTPHPVRTLAWSLGAFAGLAAALFLLRRRRRTTGETSFSDPKQLGPYRIERLLGRGGFASTFLAHHDATGTPVALKLLHPYRHDDPEFLRRFRQEARLGAMLDHPNLVRMLDPGPESGPPWLAMEYITGRRLDQKLREDGPPPLAECLRIALQIAGAMAHAHALGIVHRDLKPGNVIFEGDQAKVMDFGISRIVDSNTLTTTYAFLGTPAYAAPEAQLKVQVGPAADRYSFGIILFEMLSGHPPFNGETPFEILDKHQRAPLPDLAALRPDLPAPLVDLVARLCRKDPAARPSDDEVMDVLSELARSASPSA
ncbi:hypothetical protein GETHLI_28940 [Geothrix limicola]|uniref:Protein kinase domain-containing protein n=1 Tax=Geothrix limicola TaxID=2927978 RepID=A0ABQ5QHR7_9BACT|nr:serine/threonine-protein kinase [Geothrix limicola]GLH74392.1 hypothetical protein GETHLI_28940 [Geothrix limicola]